MQTLLRHHRSTFVRTATLLIALFIITPLAPAAPSAHAQTAVTLSFTATPNVIDYAAGEYALLEWTSTGATSCVGSDGWGGTKALSGSRRMTPAVTTTYTLACTNGTQTVTRRVTVTVKPIVSFTASPTSLTPPTSTTLTWNVTNATACSASGGWSGARATSGTEILTPALTTTYILTCTGAGGSTSKEITVDVPPVVTFETSTPYLTGGETNAMLSWSSQYANQCIASDGWDGDVGLYGTELVSPIETTTYTLTCSGDGGTVVSSVTIGVEGSCFDVSFYPSTLWYSIIMSQTGSKRDEVVLCMTRTTVQTLVDMITTAELYTLLTSLSPEASGHLLTLMTTLQRKTLLSSLTCAQTSELLSTTTMSAEVLLINAMTDAQIEALLACITTEQLVALLVGDGASRDALPCDVQERIIGLLTQEQLDAFLLDLGKDGETLNSFFSTVCGEQALYLLENASDDTQNSIVPILAIATIGIILFALSAAGQTALATVVGASAIAKAKVGSAGFLPHGGITMTVTPCTCMPGTFLITLGVLPLPLSGPRMWVPGVTRQFALYRQFVPGVWQMGIATGNMGCYMYTGKSCVVVGQGPVMFLNGTS